MRISCGEDVQEGSAKEFVVEGNKPGIEISRHRRSSALWLIVSLAVIVPLVVLMVYEPGRFRIWADGLEVQWIKVPASAVVSVAESVHSAIGLEGYKDGEASFLADAKSSPEILSSDEQNSFSEYGKTQGENLLLDVEDGQEKPKYVQKPYTILAIGDSLILEGFGPVLETKLSGKDGVEIVRKGKYSTGLSRPDYFDWNVYIVELVEKYSPAVVVVMFGANDGQNFTVDGKAVQFDSELWRSEYSRRADHFMDILDGYGVVTFWIGNPIAKSDYYTHKMEVINDCVETASEKHINVHYISTWETLKDSSGKYNDYLPDESGTMKLARSSDGIHCTKFGGSLIVDRTLEAMQTYIQF